MIEFSLYQQHGIKPAQSYLQSLASAIAMSSVPTHSAAYLHGQLDVAVANAQEALSRLDGILELLDNEQARAD